MDLFESALDGASEGSDSGGEKDRNGSSGVEGHSTHRCTPNTALPRQVSHDRSDRNSPATKHGSPADRVSESSGSDGGKSAAGASSDGQERSEITKLLRLSLLPGLGPRTLTTLLEHFGNPAAVLAASRSELASVDGVGPQLIHKIRSAADHVAAEAVVNWCDQHNVQVVAPAMQNYPLRLGELSLPPAVLFVRGEIKECDELAVAIVGTRHATSYGLRQAERFAYGLAKAGVTIISGLARGIDAAAHQGALNAGGRTVAVLGSGLAQIYPQEHQALAESVAGCGAVISEYAPETKPRGGLFPQRNRLIAGLGLATIVVEAPDRSGSLITARLAGEQSREVLAVPGPVTSRASRGCNRLIRDGATLVQTVEDVLEAIGPMGAPVRTEDGGTIRCGAELNLNDLERQVLEAIETTSTPLDRVIEVCQLPAHRVLATVSVLEIRKLVRRLSGQYVVRV